jgi:NTP pyrophosphatase (non-canonical NTP hydrolase)
MDFISKEDERLNQYYTGITRREMVLARALKLTEEVGELSNEVLASQSLQRKDKLEDFNASHLADELADVLITTLVLGKSLDIDIEKALEHKLTILNQRLTGTDNI